MLIGPPFSLMLRTAPSGTISPWEFRTLSSLIFSGSSRNSPLACTTTCQVRPKRLKSLT